MDAGRQRNRFDFFSFGLRNRDYNTNHSTYYDELDLLGQFLYKDLASRVKCDSPMMIMGGSEDIDAMYSNFPLVDSI